jgi:arylsulfatase A-like enzyme
VTYLAMHRLFLALTLSLTAATQAADQPNILWLTFEDSSPHLGCYGDQQAVTPNLDALAARGLRYQRAWSNAPVCAPARTCIISGRWAPADGAEHMRSEVPMPDGHKMSPQFLREVGYYCTNNSKEDYNLTKPTGTWDESSPAAHYRNRRDGQPFFAVFNDTGSHESQIRKPSATLSHDPAKVRVPAYMPDTPEIRRDWAQHFDNLTTVDSRIGRQLAELSTAGLAEDTIIFAYADHGTGIARSKRWPYNSGLQVPFIVHFPKKWLHLAPTDYQAAGVSTRLISFIDLAPTLLSLAGIPCPAYFHGRAFAGQHRAESLPLAYGFRSRMDERIDMSRSVTDGRFVYMRHFVPQLPEGQYLAYMFEQASTRSWFAEFEKGQLPAHQTAFWLPKPSEELYDLQSDPDEIKNLAADPSHGETRQKLAKALNQWLIETRDLGVVPEAERLAISQGASPVNAFGPTASPAYAHILEAALIASDRKQPTQRLLEFLRDADPSARYWGAQGLILRGPSALAEIATAGFNPQDLLKDSSANVRIAAAEALVQHSDSETLKAEAMDLLINAANASKASAPATAALNALDRLIPQIKAMNRSAALAQQPVEGPNTDPGRIREYPRRLQEHLSQQLGYELPKGMSKGKGKGKREGKGKSKTPKEQ